MKIGRIHGNPFILILVGEVIYSTHSFEKKERMSEREEGGREGRMVEEQRKRERERERERENICIMFPE